MSLPLLTLVAVESQAESQLALPAVVFAICFDVFKSPPHALKYPNEELSTKCFLIPPAPWLNI